MAERLVVFDTTLRDGEQSPGISLDASEKTEIAEQLARLGVDYIEAGFPVASKGDFESVQAIARRVEGPVVAALSRTNIQDVDACAAALQDAERYRIHVFISTSPSHMRYMLKMTEAEVIDQTRRAVERAHGHTPDVEFSPQDATRTPAEFMLQVLQVAVEAGATTLNIPDTVGYATPEDLSELVRLVRREVSGSYVISVHCHNDLGLATANSLAGVEGGARQVEVCVNGLGERAGNASLEEVVTALKVRSDHYGLELGVRSEELARTSRLVSRLSGYPVQFNKAVVGRNAFAHESGIHQHGVLAERSTYEIIDAADVGRSAGRIVLGKHSGRHAFADTLQKMGMSLSPEVLSSAFGRFKELADRKVSIAEADLEAIVAEELGTSIEDGFALESLEVRGGTVGEPHARVVLSRRGSKSEGEAGGDGMIDAACSAIARAAGVDAEVVEFNVSSVTKGGDALGDVVVQVESAGSRVTGRGLSTDVVEASARAYLNAVNRVVSRTGGGS